MELLAGILLGIFLSQAFEFCNDVRKLLKLLKEEDNK